MKSRVKDVKKLNSAGILSEFYIIGDEGVKNVEIMDECDKHSHSWFGWLFESSKNNEIVPEVIRTFAHRVAGDIVEQVFVEKTKQYRLVFNHIPDIGETVIFINK